MPTRNPPPVAAIVAGLVVAAAILLVVVNRAARPDRPRGDPPASRPFVGQEARELVAAGRRDEAAALLRRHLDQYPDDFDALQELVGLLPPGDKSELAVRLSRCSKADEFFVQLYHGADSARDTATRAALLAWLKAARPDELLWVCEEIGEKVYARKFAEATEQFRDRIRTCRRETPRGSSSMHSSSG